MAKRLFTRRVFILEPFVFIHKLPSVKLISFGIFVFQGGSETLTVMAESLRRLEETCND